MSKGKKTPRSKSKGKSTFSQLWERKRGIRPLLSRFLIVCEDQKSSRKYFNTLKKEYFKLAAFSVEVVGSNGRTQPIQVVERAIELKEDAARAKSGTEAFNHVWCVIDGDFGDKINNARTKAKANAVKLAISTQCFEYWVLLHFEPNDAATLNCTDTIHVLNRVLEKNGFQKYDKGEFNFSRIVHNVLDAAKRARKLREPQAQMGIQPENQNPCSEIYLLIEAILDELPG